MEKTINDLKKEVGEAQSTRDKIEGALDVTEGAYDSIVSVVGDGSGYVKNAMELAEGMKDVE